PPILQTTTDPPPIETTTVRRKGSNPPPILHHQSLCLLVFSVTEKGSKPTTKADNFSVPRSFWIPLSLDPSLPRFL
ncbi:unnamed protein product, partial [Brassica rapa]